MKKRLSVFFVILCMCLFGQMTPVLAASGSVSVSVSSATANIGDTVTVTAKASGPSGEKAVATMTVSYDSSILQFVSCSATYGGGGSSVTATADSFTVTLKAISAGTASVSLSGSDGVIFDTNEELDSMSGGSTSVTVNNVAGGGTGTGSGTETNTGTGSGTGTDTNTGTGSGTGTGTNTGTGGGTGTSAGTDTGSSTVKLSDDNSLKVLTISPGTLSPEFSGPRTSYTAIVANDVTNIAVTATPANNKAVVESVSGNTNLVVGVNTISIVVRAENGVTATYKIEVTRKAAAEQSPSQQPSSQKPAEKPSEQEKEQETDNRTITVDGRVYRVVEDFSAEDIPADFTETTVSYQEVSYKGLSFSKAPVIMLCLAPEGEMDAVGRFYVLDGDREVLYPFMKLNHGADYVIALALPDDIVLPDNLVENSVLLENGDSFAAYKEETGEEGEDEFLLFYGVNQEGAENWYRYDSVEGTYQRTSPMFEEEDASIDENMAYLQNEYNALSEKYTKEKAFSRNTIAILIFVIAVLIIVIINLLLHKRNGRDVFYDDDEDFPEGGTSLNKQEENAEEESGTVASQEKQFAAEASELQEKQFAEEASELQEKQLAEKAAKLQEKQLAAEVADLQKPELKKGERQKTDELEIIDFNDF